MLEGAAAGAEAEISLRLLSAHGSVQSVLRAHRSGASSAIDVPSAVTSRLRTLADAVEQTLSEDAYDGLRIGSLDALMRYLQFELGAFSREIFRVVYLDAGNGLLRDHILWEGTVDRVQVHAREIVREALQCEAAALILVHNHPHRDAQPSEQDLRTTRTIQRACLPFDISVHDHLIVGRDCVFSMARAGLLGASDIG